MITDVVRTIHGSNDENHTGVVSVGFDIGKSVRLVVPRSEFSRVLKRDLTIT